MSTVEAVVAKDRLKIYRRAGFASNFKVITVKREGESYKYTSGKEYPVPKDHVVVAISPKKEEDWDPRRHGPFWSQLKYEDVIEKRYGRLAGMISLGYALLGLQPKLGNAELS